MDAVVLVVPESEQDVAPAQLHGRDSRKPAGGARFLAGPMLPTSLPRASAPQRPCHRIAGGSGRTSTRAEKVGPTAEIRGPSRNANTSNGNSQPHTAGTCRGDGTARPWHHIAESESAWPTTEGASHPGTLPAASPARRTSERAVCRRIDHTTGLKLPHHHLLKIGRKQRCESSLAIARIHTAIVHLTAVSRTRTTARHQDEAQNPPDPAFASTRCGGPQADATEPYMSD